MAGDRARLRAWPALAAVLACAAFAPAQASAMILPPTVIDGPSTDILDLGGVALSSDGTGGVTWLRRTADGHSHVYAALFIRGFWSGPIRVDAGQQFDSAWPRIAAGAHGLLTVVWAQDGGPGLDRLYSATVGPGASTFDPPVLIDGAIGEDSSTFPAVAMNAGGTTYVAYRVVTGTAADTPGIPPDHLLAEVRLARFRGPRWTGLGRLNRNLATPVRTPSADNAPQLEVEPDGSAVVAWQEPDDSGFDRIWARRVFASGLGIPLLASPQTLNGIAVNGDADQFALADAPLGEPIVAFRQQPGDGAALTGARAMANILPDAASGAGAQFRGAQFVDGPPETAPGALGRVSIAAAARRNFMVGFGVADATEIAGFTDRATDAPLRLDDNTNPLPGDPLVTLGAGGANTATWAFQRDGAEGVQILERTSVGINHNAQIAGPTGGQVSQLATAGSGLGDALVAFRQGTEGDAIVVDAVDAYPQPASVNVDTQWLAPTKVRLSWDQVDDAMGPVTYTPMLDGRPLGRTSALAYRVNSHLLEDGTYRVGLVATDPRGQVVSAPTVRLRVDGTPPAAKISMSAGRRVAIRVDDGPARSTAGASPAQTKIDFGDGRHSSGSNRVAHVYKRSGRYRVTVSAQDRAGNRLRLTRTEVIR